MSDDIKFEAEVIKMKPMNGESIFGPSFYESETYGYTTDINIFAEKYKNGIHYNSNHSIDVSVDFVYYAKQHHPDMISAYITDPVALRDGIQIESKSKKFSKYIDMIDFIYELENKIFYRLVYTPTIPHFTEIDTNSYKHKILDSYLYSESYWILKYGEIK